MNLMTILFFILGFIALFIISTLSTMLVISLKNKREKNDQNK
ncbi:hypothetical protein AAPFHON13_00530 [Apilactobacillus apinorum]|nr:hypothetical protein AAPFHON13_00530 [Apilactobacillus apinorum]